MPMRQGTRDAPIIIDDEDENDIIFIAGPSRLPQKPSNGQMHSITSSSTALPKTSAASNSKGQSMSVGSCVPASSIGRCVEGETDVALRSRRNQPPSETASSSSTVLHLMPVSNTLKRKRSLEDAQSQAYRPSPLPPSWVAPVPDPSADAFAHLSKAQRKKLRRRLRAEEEAKMGTAAPKLTQLAPPPAPPVQLPRPDLPTGLILPSRNGGPERATYNGPNWPMHIAKGSEAPIPGPGLGPLSYDGSSQGSSNALSNALNSQAPLMPLGAAIGMSPNAFGPPSRIIGKWTSPGSGFGLFPVSRDQYIAHDPACTLVLENMPKRFRTLDFVLQWCRDTALANDPAPLHVDVMRKLGKALVEFTTEERAFRAFSSPKLINGDGRAQISAYWFCPESSVPASLPARPPQCTEQAVSSRPTLRFTLASPLQPSRVASAAPYSQPVHHLSTTAPSLQSQPSSDARVLEPQPRPQGVQTSQQEGRADDQRHDDTEMEEGEIEESREPDDEVRDHDDSSTTRFSPQRVDIAHVEPQGRTRQWSPQVLDCVTAPIHSWHVNVKTHAQERTPPMTPERESDGSLPTSSVCMPPWPSHDITTDLTESIKDASHHREESPQLMYPSFEESGPDSPSAGDFPAVRESRTIIAPVMSDGAIDVAMDIDIPTMPTPPTCDACLLPPPVVLTPSTDTESVTMSEYKHQPSGLNRHGPMSTLVSAQEETSKETVSSADTQLEALPQSLSEKLIELRQRVLASKKRKLATPEAPFLSSDKTTPVTTHNSAESDDATVSSARSTTSTSSTGSSSSAVSLFSTKSISTSTSISSSTGSILPKSASYFDNMATAFLEDILGTCKSGPPPSSNIKFAGLSTDKPRIDSKTMLQNKQKRFEEHLAKSKSLLAQREAAKEKSEKTRIWALIKEEQRAFEAEEAAADTELKHIEAAKATSTRPKLARKKPMFIRWPQTRLDQMILSVSDSEDDECTPEGDE